MTVPGLLAQSLPTGIFLALAPVQEREEPTFSQHVAPILRASCEPCHRPGQVAPFALQTFESARGWASMIAEVVEEGRMPPWYADPDFDGVFANERRLAPAEKQTLLRWIEAGTPAGDPALLPPLIDWLDGWTIGEPDAVYEVREHRTYTSEGARWVPLEGEGYEVPREGVVDYQYFATSTGTSADRWISAVELKAGARDVVHHIIVWADDPQAPGAWQSGESFTEYLAGSAPGNEAIVFRPGHAKRLPTGSRLVFQIHYTPNGKQRFDRSRVGLRFADGPVEHEVRTSAVYQTRFEIPPGDPYHEVRASKRLEQDIVLLSLAPHMHTRGADFYYFATPPGGERRLLLATNFDFDWQDAYHFAEPVHLPAGTLLECAGHYDNSDANPRNPDPTVAVRWGDQTFDEMFIGYYHYAVPVEARAR